MASRHRRPAAKPLAFGVAGAGLVGALVLTGPVPSALMMQAVADTIIVVGGNNDPTSGDEWNRISQYYTGSPGDVKLISYPSDVGVGFQGLPPLSLSGRDTYAGSVEQGSNSTADAIRTAQQQGDVTVYSLSLGSDVVGIALMKLGSNPGVPSGHTLTVIEGGSPSFVNSGIWNLAPPFIPGLRNGPVPQGPGASGATVTSICIKGDSICGLGTNPVTAAFYFLPGFDLHGKDYTAAKIGSYSPAGGAGFTPGATGVAPVSTTTTVDNGRNVTVDTYSDGTVKRTWVEDGTTYVVIDTGQNPWGRLLRENGVPVPLEFDKILNTVVPVPEPGQTGPLSRPAFVADAISSVPPLTPTPTTLTPTTLIPTTVSPLALAPTPVSTPVVPPASDAGPGDASLSGRHSADRHGTTPLAKLLASDGEQKDTPKLQPPAVAPAEQATTETQQDDHPGRDLHQRPAAPDREAPDGKNLPSLLGSLDLKTAPEAPSTGSTTGGTGSTTGGTGSTTGGTGSTTGGTSSTTGAAA